MENLPDEPQTYFYNHLASIEENGLANGHQFSIDSHFISAKILFPKYGDGGQRIVDILEMQNSGDIIIREF